MSEIIERRISFNGGEYGELAWDRIDLDKYMPGCLRLRNYLPSIFGAAVRRPGSIFFDTTWLNEPCRLVKFIYSTTTTRILVFGDFKMRVIITSNGVPTWEQSGGSAFELNTPWSLDELSSLHFARINDLIYVTQPGYKTRLIQRKGLGDWTCGALGVTWPAVVDKSADQININLKVDVVGDDQVVTAWKKVGGSWDPVSLFEAGHNGSTWLMTHRRQDLDVSMNLWAEAGVQPAISSYLYCLGAWSVLVTADAQPSNSYTVKLRLERSLDGVNWESHRAFSSSRDTPQVTYAGDESEPCFLRIAFVSLSGSWPSNGSDDGDVNLKVTLEVSNPDHHTLLRLTSIGGGGTSATCVALTPPFAYDKRTPIWQEPAWSGVRGYPRTICFHESRVYYGGTTADPQTVWASRIDRYTDFRTGTNDDLGLSFRAISDNANLIQWMSSGQRGLAVGTVSEEWVYTSMDSAKTITPTSGKPRRQGATGSSHLQAVAIREVVLFVGRNPNKLYEFSYEFSADSFLSADLTLFLEASGGIKQIDVQTNPESLVWVVTGRGKLMVMTYDRSQKVAGWAILETSGVVESMAIVPAPTGGDLVWIQVAREIDGETVHCLEYFQPNQGQILKDLAPGTMWAGGVWVDCAKTKSHGAPVSTVTGLEHLDGMAVSILADGTPATGEVVGGSLALPFPASLVTVGLPFTSILEPTWFEGANPGSKSKVALKRITGASICVWRSLGGSVSADRGKDGTYERLKYDNLSPGMDVAQPLFSGTIDIKVESGSRRQTTLTIKQDLPLPLTITSLYVRYEANQV